MPGGGYSGDVTRGEEAALLTGEARVEAVTVTLTPAVQEAPTGPRVGLKVPHRLVVRAGSRVLTDSTDICNVWVLCFFIFLLSIL